MHSIYFYPDKVKKLYLQIIKDKMWHEELDRYDVIFCNWEGKFILICGKYTVVLQLIVSSCSS